MNPLFIFGAAAAWIWHRSQQTAAPVQTIAPVAGLSLPPSTVPDLPSPYPATIAPPAQSLPPGLPAPAPVVRRVPTPLPVQKKYFVTADDSGPVTYTAPAAAAPAIGTQWGLTGGPQYGRGFRGAGGGVGVGLQ